MSKADDDVKAVDLEAREDSEDVDFSKLKKKKKKSKPLPAELDDRPAAAVSAPAEGAAAGTMDGAAAAAVPPKGEQTEDLDAMFGELKKKKKKKVTIEGVDDGAASPAEAAEGEFDGLKKKKSGKKKSTMAEFEEALKDEEDEFGASGITFGEGDDDHEGGAEGKEPWLGSDRDYLYKELLNRVFQNLRQFNPDLVGEKKKYTMTPPSIHREPKKTIFANLVDICRKMHRQPEHLIQFLFAELGTTGSTDGEQRLVIKGRFTPKQIEAIIRRYIMDYVQCKTCKSPDTILVKENRLFFLQCESCNSTRSVAAIKSGFKALTEKRAVQRRAAAG